MVKLSLNTKFYTDSYATESKGNIEYAFPTLRELIQSNEGDDSHPDFVYELSVTRVLKRSDNPYVDEKTAAPKKTKTKKAK